MSGTERTPAHHSAAGWALEVRAAPGRNGVRAVAARGVRPAFDASVMGVLPSAVTSAHPRLRRGLTRAVGILCGNRKLTHDDTIRVGAAIARVDNPTTERRVTLLPSLGVDDAARVLNDLLARATKVNAFDLARTLAYWDTGRPTIDREHRNRIVYDYYTSRKA